MLMNLTLFLCYCFFNVEWIKLIVDRKTLDHVMLQTSEWELSEWKETAAVGRKGNG